MLRSCLALLGECSWSSERTRMKFDFVRGERSFRLGD